MSKISRKEVKMDIKITQISKWNEKINEGRDLILFL